MYNMILYYCCSYIYTHLYTVESLHSQNKPGHLFDRRIISMLRSEQEWLYMCLYLIHKLLYHNYYIVTNYKWPA